MVAHTQTMLKYIFFNFNFNIGKFKTNNKKNIANLMQQILVIIPNKVLNYHGHACLRFSFRSQLHVSIIMS